MAESEKQESSEGNQPRQPGIWNRLASLVTGQTTSSNTPRPPPLPSQKSAVPSRDFVEPFRWNPNDVLGAEYELISQFTSQMVEIGWRGYPDIDFNATELGKKFIEAAPDAAVRLVMALVDFETNYDRQDLILRDQAMTHLEGIQRRNHPGWMNGFYARQAADQAMRRLMRRKLPFEHGHLLKMAEWMLASVEKSAYNYPVSPFVKAVEALDAIDANDQAFRLAISNLAAALRKSYNREMPALARRLETVLSGKNADITSSAGTDLSRRVSEIDLTKPALVGSPRVLVQWKQYLGILPAPETAQDAEGLHGFASDSPLLAEHNFLEKLLREMSRPAGYDEVTAWQREIGREMLKRSDQGSRLLLAMAERSWRSHGEINVAFAELIKTNPKFDREGLFDILLFLSKFSSIGSVTYLSMIDELVKQAAQFSAESPLSPGERHVLHRIRCQSVRCCPFGQDSPEVARINDLLEDDWLMVLVPGEAWSDSVNNDLSGMPPATCEKWIQLLRHASSAEGSRPSNKWLKTARKHLDEVGETQFCELAARWFALVDEPRTIRLLYDGPWVRSAHDNAINDDNLTCLRGLLWMLPKSTTQDFIRSVGALTVSCYKKIPGIGPRALKAANAGVYTLSQIEDMFALGQLALVKARVKIPSAQKEIEKAFNAAAERSGLPREELEEMSVPTYGMSDVGVLEETMGEHTARLAITGTTSTELFWLKPGGKTQQSVPASVKESNKEELKEIQASAKDIQRMLPAQRDRIDSLFLQQRSWPLPIWSERYLNHPLVGTLSRRILWDFKDGDTLVTAIWFNGRLVDLDLKPVELREEATTVQLWHPIGKNTEEIVAWRSWLDTQGIQQPFKQAHREIYVVTDAERNTRIYSNRHAAHILKQHQFNALCAARGWKNKLRLMVDDEYSPPSLQLPQWGLRAEFWVESAGMDADTNESGVYLYLSTDQVRFYRLDAPQRTAHAGGGGYHPSRLGAEIEPVPVEEIPPLVFSEVMRDVDLFVGVASVGNDPAWSDGGPGGRYHDYWQKYSFGELGASARTRMDVLQRLIPKLKIAKACSFDDKFLVVKGSLRTYKIHLGSGNILMEPNDQYLCIVPDNAASSKPNDIFLPFEGDRTLSIIISKAFLLAADAKIKDLTILQQIQRK